MTRILLHYDIDDEEKRVAFQKFISNEEAKYPFVYETDSVYSLELNVSVDQSELRSLKEYLLAKLGEQEDGRSVFLEIPERVAGTNSLTIKQYSVV